jgi:hypothetical protein
VVRPASSALAHADLADLAVLEELVVRVVARLQLIAQLFEYLRCLASHRMRSW